MSGAVLQRPKLEFERAAPAPPPPPPNSRGRDGPGDKDDGGYLFVTRLSVSQVVELLDDWIARTRIYCMSSQFGNAADVAVSEVHRKSLEDLKVLRSFRFVLDQSSPKDGFLAEALFMALYASDKKTVLALAGGSMLWEKHNPWDPAQPRSLQIKHVSVNPYELNKDSSAAALKIKQGLRLMTDNLGADLTLPENGDGE